MTKYVMCIDYKAATHKGLEYKVMNAKTVLEAIAEADARWDENIYWTRLDEMVEDIEEYGCEVLDSNDEYIVICDPDEDNETVLYLGHANTTIWIERIR